LKVYIPYHESAPQPWTVHWQHHYCPHAEQVKIQPGSNYYAEQIAQWWAIGEPFIIVEHDVVPWPGAIEMLAECPEPWCAIEVHPGYHLIRHGSVGLSCIKVVPKLLSAISEQEDRPRASGAPFPDDYIPWHATDSVFSQVLFDRGYMVHQHWPSVANLNGDYPVDPQPLRDRRGVLA
jgi:hypothetical protein